MEGKARFTTETVAEGIGGGRREEGRRFGRVVMRCVGWYAPAGVTIYAESISKRTFRFFDFAQTHLPAFRPFPDDLVNSSLISHPNLNPLLNAPIPQPIRQFLQSTFHSPHTSPLHPLDQFPPLFTFPQSFLDNLHLLIIPPRFESERTFGQ